MKRSLAVVAALVVCASCTKPPASPPPAGTSPTAQAGAQPGAQTPVTQTPVPATGQNGTDQVSMTGNLTFKLFDTTEEGVEQRPTFEVTAPQGSLLEGNVWALKNATAVVFGKDGEETRFEAGSARVDNEHKTALLSEGVKIQMGTRQIELQDVAWNNDKREALSENEATLTDGETKLNSKGMEFHADTQELILRNVVGKVSMQGGAAQ
ncbi:MAG: LPS export ABC transporter periplasmic protein LptC [Candidatus Hydrogenedentales bacterium]